MSSISEPTLRSQFLAYYSFTAANNTQGVGFQPHGGRRVENTDCDWLYQDFSCKEPDTCRLASPGYPGVYSPNRVCKFHITTSSIHTRVRIKVVVMNLPHNQCNSDYVSIHQGSTTTSPVLNTLCGNKRQELVYTGPNLLIAFKSGPSAPPYDYNGFLITLEFWDKVTTTTEAVLLGLPMRPTDQTVMSDGSQHASVRPACETIFYSNNSKSGHFDSKSHDWHQNCSYVFLGTQSEVVHLSLFNYKLKSLSCQSVIETYDGVTIDASKPVTRICSPITRHARDPTGRFQSQQTFMSTGNAMTLLLRRMPPLTPNSEPEFLDGAFHFHNEQVSGTLQPDTLCSSDYYGLSSSPRGQVTRPGQEPIFWNIDGPLECSKRFIPAVNQSISLQITLIRLSPDLHCHTECGDSSCRCVVNSKPLSQIDHLKVVTESGLLVACLCGDFQQEWLPVGLRSWSPIRLIYYVAHYSWESKGFEYTADYKFISDSYCGHHTTTQHTGFIESGNLTETGQLNHFFHQTCTWLLDSHVERQLTIQLASNQNRPCSAWNFTIHEYAEDGPERTGKTLYNFCPRQKIANYSLPFQLNVVVIKLTAMSSIPPEFQIKWRSQIVRANTRTAVSVPVMSSQATCVSPVTMATVLLGVLSATYR
ncbi:hypothetical protein J6590_067958 [Homalodisca vitripennis]|nr:hypothetical protein J6590_067958 [Homalodisca vitripennis]